MRKFLSLVLCILSIVSLLGGCNVKKKDPAPLTPEGLLALYRMDDAEGETLTDSSGNGLNGSVQGAGWVPGLLSGSLEFGGESWAQLPQEAGNTQDFTFAAWIYWKGGAVDQPILDFSKNKKAYMYLTPRGGLPGNDQDYIRFAIRNGDEEQRLTTEDPLPGNQWVHVAVTLEGEVGRLYVDGQLKDSNPNMTIDPADVGFEELYLGRGHEDKTPGFKGRMDQVLLAGRALSQKEIEELANPVLFSYSMEEENRPEGKGGLQLTDAGFLGRGLSFEGQGAYAVLPAEVASAEDLTFAAWVRWDGGDGEQHLFHLGEGEGAQLFLSPDRDGRLTLGVSSPDGVKTVTAPGALETGRWVHLAATLRGGRARLYLDGVLAGEGDLQTDPRDLQAKEAFLGHNPGEGGAAFRGVLDEVVLYANALSDETVARLATAALAHYPLDGSLDNSDGPLPAAQLPGEARYAEGYAAAMQALSLDGTAAAELDSRLADSANLSFVAWVNLADGGEQTFFSFGQDADNRLSFGRDAQGLLRLETRVGGSGQVLAGASTWPAGEWRQVAFTLQDGTARLYLDGELQAEAAGMPRPQEIPHTTVHLGADVSGQGGLRGRVQQVSLFGAALSEEQICTLQRQVIDFPDEDLNLEYVKGGDPTIAEDYAYWGYSQEHDGEIVKDGDTYYMYSTDNSPGNQTQLTAPLRPAIQIRRSTDLIHWEFVGWVWDEVPKEAARWTGTTDMLWAPGVGKIGDTWYLYYAVSSLGNRQTYLGVATSDSPAGPWTDQGEVFKVANNDPQYEVNPIDPQLLIDKEGRPWLSYGSYYGGIYINELDPHTGKFLTYGEGTCIARRTDRIDVAEQDSIEGVFIVYHEPSDKYVMFVSYDHFYGDYNLRVGRSDRPDGVYLDFNGNRMTDTALQQREQVGTKIMGSYRFQGHPGWIGLGHNAVYEENGQWFCLNNSHFVNDASYCYMQLRTLLWTEDGWPVVSPERYAGERAQKIPEKALAGEWEWIRFELQDKSLKTASRFSLALDGSFDGDSRNRWALEGDNRLVMREYDESVAGNYRVYTAYVLPAWDWETWQPCLVFTGFDQFGEAVWGKSV